jgi:serine/threonine protein kinase
MLKWFARQLLMRARFHQDIKPANILVTSNKSSSYYKWQFKVADLGLSHFKRVVDELGSITGNDAQGTRCYGQYI